MEELELELEEQHSFEKSFTNLINSQSFSEYLAPSWIDESEEQDSKYSSNNKDSNDSITHAVTETTTRTPTRTTTRTRTPTPPLPLDLSQQTVENESEYVIYDEKTQSYTSITELVSYELESYVNIYINAFVESFKVYVETEISDSVDLDFNFVTNKLQALVSQSIHADATKNSLYCKKLMKWLASKSSRTEGDDRSQQSGEYSSAGPELSNQISTVNEVCDEYMKFAPGPWRECVLVEAFKGRFLPELQSTILKQLTQAVISPRVSPRAESRKVSPDKRPIFQSPDEKNKSESTEIEEVSLSVSEGDDFSDSVSSIGGDRGFDQSFDQTISVSLNNSFGENSVGQKIPSRSRNRRMMMMAGSGPRDGVGGARGVAGGTSHRHMALNKYKTEIAMLQNQLEDAQAVDKSMLQARIREYQLDVDSLRERNHDLREQLSELNMKYFEMVLAGRNKNKNRGDNRMKNSPRISQNVDASLTEDNSSSDDDNEFQDTVPNVEDAYAIKSHSKSSTGRKPISNFLSSDASSSADDKASHEVLEPVGHSLTPDEVTELRNTLNLYEKQFDLMKTEIRFLRMSDTRGSAVSRAVISHGPGGTPFASLNEKSLRVAGGTEGKSSPLADTVLNHKVSFETPVVDAAASSCDQSRNSFDYVSEDGIWKSVNADGESVSSGALIHAVEQGKPPLSFSSNAARGQDQHQIPSDNQQLGNLNSMQQRKYIEKMIQKGIDAGKEIDKKTIQSLSEEVSSLTLLLKEQGNTRVQSSALSRPLEKDSGSVTVQDESSKFYRSKKSETELELEVMKLRAKVEKMSGSQRPYSTYQLQLLYSFIFGGIMILVFSTFVSWMRGIIRD